MKIDQIALPRPSNSNREYQTPLRPIGKCTFKYILAIVLLLIAGRCVSHAQEASLTGVVVDPSGAALGKAALTVTEQNTGFNL